jgi:hypothetical protein
MHMQAYQNVIAERTRNFTGREWGFAEIGHWLADSNAPRFFILANEPGIGKTAVTPRLAQTCHLGAHHFCITPSEKTTDCLRFIHTIGGRPGGQSLCQV